jgi:hypothetical protein
MVGMADETFEAFGRCWQRAARRFHGIAREVASATGWLVLHPGRYGERWHARFRRLYPPGPRPLLVFGLNPGPYGMAQTGVPFTDLKRLQFHLPELWRELDAAGEPMRLPGLAPRMLRPHLTRTFESSSVRIYRFLEQAFGSPAAALRQVVFVNPCPLLFIDPQTSENKTPEHLPGALRASARGRARRVARDAAARGEAAALMTRFDDLRRETVLEAVRELRPRGAILLGRDVAAAVGEPLRAALGAECVVEWEHPARAPPDLWARGLTRELERRGLLRGYKDRRRERSDRTTA